jgi:hypothetical protein
LSIIIYPYPILPSIYIPGDWGEAGIIKTGKDGKIGDQEITGMFMGYASNHEGNCYRM